MERAFSSSATPCSRSSDFEANLLKQENETPMRFIATVLLMFIGPYSLSQPNSTHPGTSLPAIEQQRPTAHKYRPAPKRYRVHSSIKFSFDILNMVTNHQFDGQQNSFHMTYEYVTILKQPPFDSKGGHVASDIYPFFQNVRSDIIRYIDTYPSKNDFYEIFGLNMCRYVLESYPQIKSIEMTIDIPGYKGVTIDRKEIVVLHDKSLFHGLHRRWPKARKDLLMQTQRVYQPK
jgi:hypothetical protein